MKRVAAILLAGGSGKRFARALTPSHHQEQEQSSVKQYVKLGGKAVIRHAAEAILPFVDFIQPVGDAARLQESLGGLAKILPTVAGGTERQDSVRAGLDALAALSVPPDLVLIHDGARPYVPAEVTRAVIDALEHHQGAIPAISVSDTLKYEQRGLISATIPREYLWRAQTPQGFSFPTLHRLHQDKLPPVTDDAALFEREGLDVAIVQGSEDNIKLTSPLDLKRLERLLVPSLFPRTGLGYDVHAFADNRPLILCGVTIPFERGLAGHSDADVGIHTLCDAIYGALAEGDIGYHFPPSEGRWKDMDSAKFLIHAGERIRARGGRLINADLTLICERPKIGPYVLQMRQRLAELLDVSIERISVKATTSERLGFTGREEGIAATAIASVALPETASS